MVSSLCSIVVITVPLVCVVLSLFCSRSVPSVGIVDIGFYGEKLFETSYVLLCSLPYKVIFIDLKRCGQHQQSEPETVSTIVGQNDAKKNSKLLEVKVKAYYNSYSEIDTFMLGMLKDENDQQLKQQGTREHGFNLFASDNIGLWRNIPDTRHDVCKEKLYNKVLPTASIVMCFYNEAWSTLLRSIHSILSHTPKELIKEIILLDDDSSFDHLKLPLDEYIKANFTNVNIIHSPVRLGLIRARMEGAKHATGEVLVFLDSHIEVGEDWLPPLLDRITMNRKCVVIPVVDTIEGETMIYKKANIVRGGFTWTLLHNWEQLPIDVLSQVELNYDPFISPTMPGGLFAMERNYFYELGEYDSGMDIWGGENIEISFRIWLCGGRLEIVPCSRIGHVFRQFRPYASPDGQDTATRNAARVAHVWLDDYKKHFFDIRPEAMTKGFGDVSDRIALRERLGCKSFHWFLETIHPEQIVPGEKAKVPGAYYRRPHRPKPTILAEGFLRHQRSSLCVVPERDPPLKGMVMILEKCHLLKQDQAFILTDEYQLKLAGNNFCLDTRANKQQEVFLMKCAAGGSQTWLQLTHDGHQVLYNPPSGKCLAVTEPQRGSELALDFCSSLSAQSFLVQ